MTTTLEAELLNPDDWVADALTRFAASEENREAAENKRVAAEKKREESEQERTTAEQKRVTAETERVSAESKRASAEQAREQYLTDLKADVDAGVYSGASYKPIVTAQGSSIVVSFENDKELPNPDPVTIGISAEVDSATGTPSVDVTAEESTVTLSFHGLKGKQGDPGESGGDLDYLADEQFRTEVEDAWK